MVELLKGKRVGLDCDGVLACFICGLIRRAHAMGLAHEFPYNCKYVKNWDTSDKFSEVMNEAWHDENFWLQLPRLHTSELPFIPDVYITSRRIPTEVTKKWLDNKGFPEAEVITVNDPLEKLQVCIDKKIDIFVDDYYVTVKHLRENGINALLWRQPYQCGHKNECADLPTIDRMEDILLHV